MEPKYVHAALNHYLAVMLDRVNREYVSIEEFAEAIKEAAKRLAKTQVELAAKLRKIDAVNIGYEDVEVLKEAAACLMETPDDMTGFRNYMNAKRNGILFHEN